ncbi:MAG: response regulator [Candidatus Portnoybacteria bacterium CG23_combo_of_CG06-09_8_20_14_all_37_13]|uniref:Response regulator n=1 Tax=Candidatus Portnoybacteria bacterium CG23_combo_of_CG06-09_8_20_14_all_37_13 TaxID=1974819 RepID=A0A2G9YDX6_9BACT|nr:MAG: response regulator [Candidatus Portnoybacteria bacterium CG23_combo_of_CG06-09_8_20_14_all_37_13]
MNKTILFIEDEAHFQKLVGEQLEEQNFKVLSALNGEIGLKKAIENKPNLILLDLILPKKDGFEVLKELKASEQTKNIPVIVLTNLESAQDVQRALNLGATTYLVKTNYKLEEIIKKIKELCA